MMNPELPVSAVAASSILEVAAGGRTENVAVEEEVVECSEE